MDVVVAIIVKSPGIYKSWADMNHMSNMVFVIFFPCAVVFSLAVSSAAAALYAGMMRHEETHLADWFVTWRHVLRIYIDNQRHAVQICLVE